jgi:hypothetical protein
LPLVQGWLPSSSKKAALIDMHEDEAGGMSAVLVAPAMAQL